MRIIITIFTLILTISCSKKGNLQAFDSKVDRLEFGNGGGFTGAFSSVCLLPNGEVYRKTTSDTTFIKLGKIDINKAKQVFLNYNTLGLDKMQLNEPGNRYYFITSIANGQNHKLTWGKSELQNNAPVLLMKIMNDMVKHLEEKQQK